MKDDAVKANARRLLRVKLYGVVEDMRMAIGSDDGHPRRFRTEVEAILQRHGDSLDPELVFGAAVAAARGLEPCAIDHVLDADPRDRTGG